MKTDLKDNMMPCPQCGVGIRIYKGKYFKREIDDALKAARRNASRIRRNLKKAGMIPQRIKANEDLLAAEAEVRRISDSLAKTVVKDVQIACIRCGFVRHVGLELKGYGRLLVVWADGRRTQVLFCGPHDIRQWKELLADPAAASAELSREFQYDGRKKQMLFSGQHDIRQWKELLADPAAASAELSRQFQHDGEPFYVQLSTWDKNSQSIKVLGEMGQPVALSAASCDDERTSIVVGSEVQFGRLWQRSVMRVTLCPHCGIGVIEDHSKVFTNKDSCDAYQEALRRVSSINKSLKVAGVPAHQINTNNDLLNACMEVNCLEETKVDASVIDCIHCGYIRCCDNDFLFSGRLVVVWPDGIVEDARLSGADDLRAWQELLTDPESAFDKLGLLFGYDCRPFYVRLTTWDDESHSLKVLGELGHPVMLNLGSWPEDITRRSDK